MPIDERALFNTTRHGLTLRPAPTDDHSIGALIVTSLQALRELTPRRARVTSTRRTPFAAAHRMVDRVHGDAAVVRTLAEPARAAGLAHLDVLVLLVRHLSDRRAALDVHLADLAAR